MLSSPSESSQPFQPRVVLVAGATGYVGGRLIPQLEQQPVVTRCLARKPEQLRPRVLPTTQIVPGDVLDSASLDAALQGVHTAYYLVHLMSDSKDFEQQDRQAAQQFGAAAKKAGVQRIINLGGLGDDTDPQLSPHLRSRHEVGEILRNCGVETIEFRASLVIGSGSLSFDLMNSLTERLPVMLCPRWLTTPTQPIAVDDVVAYLLTAKELPPGESRIVEIGGKDVVTYGKIIQEYAIEQLTDECERRHQEFRRLMDTLGGLVFEALGRRPRVGDEVTLGVPGISVRVESIDELAVLEVSLLLGPKVQTQVGEWAVAVRD